MKKISILIAMITLACLSAFKATAGGYDVIREKKVSKHYHVFYGEKLSIENSYGQVHVDTWDKDEVNVDIMIIIKGTTDAKVEELINRIRIDEDVADKRRIALRTVIDIKYFGANFNNDIQINYFVHMPKRNPLDLFNKFGDVYIDDIAGALRAEVQYGALKTEKLTAGDKHIKVSFGSVDIKSIETGKIDVSYSKLNIDEAGEIDVTNKFAATDITTVKNLKIDQEYGDLEIGLVDVINGKVEFANMRIDKLHKNAYLSLEYCSKGKIDMVGPKVESLRINSQFSNTSIRFDEDANLSGEVSIKYGELRSKPFEFARIDEDGSNKRYKGKIGAGAGNMTILSSYGDVIFLR